MSFLNWMSSSMNSPWINNLLCINSISIKCSYFLRRNIWSIDISSFNIFISIFSSSQSRAWRLDCTMHALVLSKLSSIWFISNSWLIRSESSIISSLIKLVLIALMVNISSFGLKKVVLSISLIMLNRVITILVVQPIVPVNWRADSLCSISTLVFLLVPHVVLHLISWVICNVNCLVLLRVVNCLIWRSVWVI